MPGKTKNISVVRDITVNDHSESYIILAETDFDNYYNNKTHYHSFWELMLFTSGSGTIEINNVRFPIKRGMLCLTTPADFHLHSVGKNESFENYIVQFQTHHLDANVSSELYACSEPIVLYLDEEKYGNANRDFAELTTSYEAKGRYYDLETRNRIENICIGIINELSGGSGSPSPSSVIKNAIIYVKNNYRGNITLHSAAEYVGLSDAYFSHIFKTGTGVGFALYVRNMRLNAAANLLKSTDMTVSEICYMVGIDNPDYFSNTFKKYFSIPPREYREKYIRETELHNAD